MKKRVIIISVSSVVFALAVFFTLYTANYSHADSAALRAMESDGAVKVSKTDYGFFFDGPSNDNALIFYPGGKVEETAYAPLLHKLSLCGIDVCLVKMPLRFAFLGFNKAEKVINEYDYKHWYIGGHSLGGVFASYYASKNADSLDGVILLASYSVKKLDDGLNAVSVYGSEDNILSAEDYYENKINLPAGTREFVIEGANHAQFGSYGLQDGDGNASISADEQADKTVEIIINSIN